ncbi:hypothetical protein NRS6206_04311 [Bacillus subtilis]|nr:hypothetical protein NRS6103_01135 [Bacillus subtilis]CAF1919008.1 hypothetical protein NRS6206_04311 [Bacillus subtilis]
MSRCHVFLMNGLYDQRGVFFPTGRKQIRRSTGKSPPKQLPHRRIKGKRGFHHDNVIFRKRKLVLHAGQKGNSLTVLNGHSFRLPGRARCIDDIGERSVANRSRHMTFYFFTLKRCHVNFKRLSRKVRCGASRLCQQERCPAVFQHVAQPLLWIRRIKRQIRPSGLQYSKDSDQHVR